MMRNPKTRATVAILALAVCYLIAARLGLLLDAVSGFATLVWAPTGIALACLLRGGEWLWPGVTIGAFAANLWVGAPWYVALGIAAGNTAEAIVGARLIRRVAGVQPLDSLLPAVGLVVLGAGVSTLISATVGVACLWSAGVTRPGELTSTWRAWWLGDASGDLLVAPLLLAWSAGLSWRRRPALAGIVEIFALAGVLVALAYAVFFEMSPEAGLSYSYLVFPPLIWAALRFRERGSTLATLVVSAVGIWATVDGRGPFVAPRLATSLLHLQAFMATVAVTTLMLAVAVSEKERAVAARQAILAVVSHDLRNPLSAIRLSTATMLRAPPEPASLTKNLQRVDHAAKQMELLLHNLLDLAAIDSGRMEMRKERIDAGAVLVAAVELMRPIAGARGQTIDGEIAGPLFVVGDRERLTQVLSNLIGNAIKFAPEASAISVRLEPGGEVARVSVSDRGPGLSREQAEHAFDRFWKAKPAGEGLGLGLSIAREIVEAQGGRIWVETSPGAGATFCFTLPIAPS